MSLAPSTILEMYDVTKTYLMGDTEVHALRRVNFVLFDGVAQVETRIVVNVNLDIPGLDEPATGRLISLPEQRPPRLNDVYLKQGRGIADGQREVLISDALATANGLVPGDSILLGLWLGSLLADVYQNNFSAFRSCVIEWRQVWWRRLP